MGTTQSAQPIDPSISNSETPTSGVRITGSAIKSHEELLQDAYNRGRQEALNSFDEIAAQVYENSTKKIVDAENASLAKSNKILKDLQGRLKSPPKLEVRACLDPRSTLLRCLQENQGSPLTCNRLVEDYYQCATTEFESN